MPLRSSIVQLAKLVGRDLRRGNPSEDALASGRMLASVGATVQVLEGLLTEASRKRPNDEMVDGYAFILQSALDALRIDANGGRAQARADIDEVRQAVEQAIIRGGLSGPVLMLVGRAFAHAELDPGRPLQEALVGAIDREGLSEPASANLPDMFAHFAKIAKAMDDDPFAIHAELAQTVATFPSEHRAAFAATFAASDVAAIREAVLGFALDADREVGAAVLSVLANGTAGQSVSSNSVDRLVRVRPWLIETRRSEIDAAIRALRPKAGPPAGTPRAEIRNVMASMPDGSGAQSFFAIVKRGRHLALASVLVKSELGVADAWVRDGMSKAEADDVIEQIFTGAEAVEVSIGMFERRVADALAINLKLGTPPPFGLLQVTETLGLGLLQPKAILPAELADELLAELPPASTDLKAREKAHHASANWHVKISTLRSWFEAGEAVEALLRPIKTRRKRIEAMLAQYLPTRRLFWADRCAWTAYILKEAHENGAQDWTEFALVARDFAGDKSLDTLPIAQKIAEKSVLVFAMQPLPPSPPVKACR